MILEMMGVEMKCMLLIALLKALRVMQCLQRKQLISQRSVKVKLIWIVIRPPKWIKLPTALRNQASKLRNPTRMTWASRMIQKLKLKLKLQSLMLYLKEWKLNKPIP